MFSCEYRENVNNISFERHLSPTDFELYLFEVEQITKKKQRRIKKGYSETYSEPSKPSKMIIFAKIVDSI